MHRLIVCLKYTNRNSVMMQTEKTPSADTKYHHSNLMTRMNFVQYSLTLTAKETVPGLKLASTSSISCSLPCDLTARYDKSAETEDRRHRHTGYQVSRLTAKLRIGSVRVSHAQTTQTLRETQSCHIHTLTGSHTDSDAGTWNPTKI